jgi:hypothetical protein
MEMWYYYRLNLAHLAEIDPPLAGPGQFERITFWDGDTLCLLKYNSTTRVCILGMREMSADGQQMITVGSVSRHFATIIQAPFQRRRASYGLTSIKRVRTGRRSAERNCPALTSKNGV